MSVCAIFRFGTVLDDVQLHSPAGRCVRLRCSLRKTGDLRQCPPRFGVTSRPSWRRRRRGMRPACTPGGR